MVVLLLAAGQFLFAQTRIGSPYSRFGLGDIHRNSSIVLMGMGGTSLAFSSPYYINVANPASYGAFDTTSFVFDGSAYGKFSTLKTDVISQKTSYASLGSLLFGFPVAKWWKTSLGLLPMTTMGYKIADTQIDTIIRNADTMIGKNKSEYEGSGGLSQVYWGNSFRLYKNFYAGVNMSFIFGPLDKVQAITFPDSLYYYGVKTTTETYVQDFLFNYGLLYRKTFNGDRFISAGLTFSNSQKLTVTDDILSTTFVRNYSLNIDSPVDTVTYSPRTTGTIKLPSSLGIGISFGRTDRWLSAIDFKMQNWSKFKYYNETNTLKNSFDFSAGTQFKPAFADVGSYLKRMQYRAGFRYSQTYLELKSTQLNEYAFSFGLGLPLRKTKSTFNLAAEFGRRGATNNGLIRDNFVRLSFGVSFVERWFIQRKYD
ncbi:MAG: hypothetical protein ACOYMF_04390 [Bacteroidales bacterium]